MTTLKTAAEMTTEELRDLVILADRRVLDLTAALAVGPCRDDQRRDMESSRRAIIRFRCSLDDELWRRGA